MHFSWGTYIVSKTKLIKGPLRERLSLFWGLEKPALIFYINQNLENLLVFSKLRCSAK